MALYLIMFVVWLLFGGLAAFGYWRSNHTDSHRKHRWITTLLILGGMITLMLSDSFKLRHHRHNTGART
jgi:formate hydrogenlyase subunit 3/multisubunit Na+/H+ antiporter MnhD subunit